MGRWVWMGVGCPCPPVRNDIVTPRHLLFLLSRVKISFATVDIVVVIVVVDF